MNNDPVRMKCARDTCQRKARPGKNRGLCEQHYLTSPLRGYVDSARARERLELLRSRGVTLAMLGDHGLSKFGVRRIENAPRIRRMTEAKLFSIPVPPQPIATLSNINSIGTVRRIRAISAMGWTQRMIAEALGTSQNAVSAITRRDKVTADMAIRVAELFDRWAMTPGPSQLTRDRARAAGWVTALAWNDIDDPSEIPNVGVHRAVKFDERYREMRDLGLSHTEIAHRLGITGESLARQMARYDIDTTGVVA